MTVNSTTTIPVIKEIEIINQSDGTDDGIYKLPFATLTTQDPESLQGRNYCKSKTLEKSCLWITFIVLECLALGIALSANAKNPSRLLYAGACMFVGVGIGSLAFFCSCKKGMV